MKNKLLYLSPILSIFLSNVQAEQLNIENSCNYGGGMTTDRTAILFSADKKTETIIKQIIDKQNQMSGSSLHFEIRAAGVANASAIVNKGQRYILYNQGFFSELTNKTNTNWATASVLAHEIAHHVHGDSLQGSKRHNMELSADKFSGAILQKMGATMQEATLALKSLGRMKSSITHPATNNRIAAIESGWISSEETVGRVKPQKLIISKLKFTPEAQPKVEFVKGGSFVMGSPESQKSRYDDEKQHTVQVADFYMGKYEVTQAQWQAIMGNNPSKFKGNDLPVEKVNLDDIQTYLKKLNAKTGKQYRLPTEAEWEYACRSGGQTQTYCGGESFKALAWYEDNSANKTHKVGTKKPNGLGLFDMSGNVREWTCSEYEKNYNGKESKCVNNNGSVVIRGGSRDVKPLGLRSAFRYGGDPLNRNNNLGFRVSRTR